MRTIKSLCAIAIFSFALGISLISSARADHEGPYVIGETKKIGMLWACVKPKPLQTAFAALPDARVASKILSESTECFFIEILVDVKVIGQIGKDFVDKNSGITYRIVHVKAVREKIEMYLLVYGTETKVVAPGITL